MRAREEREGLGREREGGKEGEAETEGGGEREREGDLEEPYNYLSLPTLLYQSLLCQALVCFLVVFMR